MATFHWASLRRRGPAGQSAKATPPPAADARGARASNAPPAAPGRRARPGWFWPLVLLMLAINWWFASTLVTKPSVVTVPYSPTFLEQLDAGNVESVSFKGDEISGTFKTAVRYPADDKDAPSATVFKTRQPPQPAQVTLLGDLESHAVVVSAKAPDQGSPLLVTLLVGFGPTLVFVGLLVWFMRRAASSGGASGLMGFGRSRARRYEGGRGQRVTFDDVAGIDEARDELLQIVGFLADPEPFRRVGARIPRGVLLTGPPGTGKTLLARAVAGEADVPFFSMSASEFIEMIVGVGASRVRDLFAQAKAAAPSIVFIDELDAVGRSRGAAMNLSGGSDEREQTLNQILTEMDGFEPSTAVIVLAATNRPDVLDPALLRAGRFDRRVAVQPPDREGRLAILRVHTREMPLARDVDLAAVAASTPGMVGADLASLANEAALAAAARRRTEVRRKDFDAALARILLGTERKVVLSARDRERTAYHEAGHALVNMLSPNGDPVRTISIIPRGSALGVTFSAPDADRYSYGREELRTKIRVALGGRAAEELVYGEITTGAESDIDQLTHIARHMVGRWGMSDTIGPVAVVPPDGHIMLPGDEVVSADTQRVVDAEVRRIVAEAHVEAMELLRAHRDQLEALTHALLAAETLEGPDAYAAAGVDAPGVPAPAHLVRVGPPADVTTLT
jgi:cell division protease FtsH